MSERPRETYLYLDCFPDAQQNLWSKIVTRVKPRLISEAAVVAAIPIDMKAAHFFNPTTKDRI